jgi:hypothetical protein
MTDDCRMKEYNSSKTVSGWPFPSPLTFSHEVDTNDAGREDRDKWEGGRKFSSRSTALQIWITREEREGKWEMG